MDVKEEIKKSTVSEITITIIRWLLPLLSTLFLSLVPQVRDRIWPTIPKWLLLVLTLVFLSAALALFQLLLKSRRRLKETQGSYDELTKPDNFEPDEKDKEILRYLFQSNDDLTFDDIKRRVRFKYNEELNHHLSRLSKHDYIDVLPIVVAGQSLTYYLSGKGREYALEKLLKPDSDI